MSHVFDDPQARKERPTQPRVRDIVRRVPRAVLRVVRREEGAKGDLLDLLFGPVPGGMRRR